MPNDFGSRGWGGESVSEMVVIVVTVMVNVIVTVMVSVTVIDI